MKSDFLKIIKERGFLNQATNIEALDEQLSKQSTAGYIGYDCTADSLHVGSLLTIMLLRWFQKTGHKPVIVMGGGTSKIGDPSFRDDSRPLLNDEAIAKNMNGIKKVFEKYLNFNNGVNNTVMVNNNDWLSELSYIPFLRDYGTHFTINRMLAFDSVKLRLEREQPLTFLEFNYMILQAYDFLELFKKHQVVLQMGGSDQWGNIINGVELIRRLEAGEAFGLTTPLITTSSGAKMGKTASGAVWLNEEKLTPYDYWQFWRNTEDADVGRFLRFFTELPLSEIVKLESLKDAEINHAKKILAFEATKLCHGEEAAQAAMKTAQKTFEEGLSGDHLPTITITVQQALNGITAVQAFKETGLCASNGEVKRLIKQGGAKVNDQVITDENFMITENLFQDHKVKLSSGKKKHALIKISH